MHFKNGFKDRNSERYMISARVKKLIDVLRREYWYDTSLCPGILEKKEGLLSHDELANVEWEPFDGTKEKWGGENCNVWFRQSLSIPPEMDGKPVVYAANLRNNGGWYWGAPQILAYVNGKVVTGMDVNHREIYLTDSARVGDTYLIELCAFTDRFFYNGQVEMNMGLYAVNPEVQQLYYDLYVPFEVSEYLDGDDIRRIDIIYHLNKALSMVDFRLPKGEQFNATVREAIEYMRTEFYGRFCGHDECTVTCVGHSHIDTAWLWTLEQTRKKVARSFSTALHLMDRYDDFLFMASQPQQYVYFREALPESYEKLKEYVKNSRWQPEGAMWVEADTNIPNGESLVRQIIYGKRFFKEQFGADSKILWLPDVFGYSGALPQILKKSGVDYFMTTKISWNEYNKLPYDTFVWKGIDGSEVLSHFICTRHSGESETQYMTTYNGYLSAPYVMGAWERYQQKDLNRDILFSFGFGDGGGGPNAEMMEYARRMAKGIPGCPKVKIDMPLNFFKKLEKEVSGNKRLPVWSGELYFEYHRGTYTSMARIKKNVRKSEILLQDAELYSSMLETKVAAGKYPAGELSEAWKLLLLNEFHDILPGSSIKEVYEDSDAQFEEILNAGKKALNEALDGIASNIRLCGDALVVFNSTSFERDDIVEFKTGRKSFDILDNGASVPWQTTADGSVVFFAKGIPAKGYKVFYIKDTANAPVLGKTATVNGRRLETDHFILEFDANGNICSLYSKAMAREMVESGKPMNRLVAFEDMPPNDDAWNINAYIDEKSWTIDNLEDFEILENGPVRCVARLTRRFMDSVIVQDFVLYGGLNRIDVKNRIDWKEKNILLKADFPFGVNAQRATYDIQFGNIERSTNENTSWDFAQFEVCAQRWADLSEGGYGLSILNDCKYGYDIKNGHMRLTLLKSAVYPNPDADKELHEFVYSIYPHAGTWKEAETVKHAAFLNCPPYVCEQKAHGGNLEPLCSMVRSSHSNVIIDTVKKAEDGDGFIVRLYECHNRTTDATLTFSRAVGEAFDCDLLENCGESLGIDRHGDKSKIRITVKPYEVRTLRVRF